MAKSYTSTSISVAWENSPDTPITSNNLSQGTNFIASYRNANSLNTSHVEGQILFPNPADTKTLLLKRDTVIQIINSSVDAYSIPVVPKNSHTRIFSVGEDDIVISPAETDETNPGKAYWGNTNLTWYVYFCDKNDGVIFTKTSDSNSYPGGAQLLVSTRSDFPLGDVPDNLGRRYSVGDSRCIGGFSSDALGNVIPASIWDISGKINRIYTKEIRYVDPFAPINRLFQVNDLDTSIPTTFNNTVILKDATLSSTLSVTGAATLSSITATGTLTQNGLSNLIGNTAITGTLQVSQNISAAANLSVVNITGANITLSGNVSANNISATGLTTLAATSITGQLSHLGNASIGSIAGTVSIAGTMGFTGNLDLNGDITIHDGTKTNLHINRDTDVIDIYSVQTNHTGVFNVIGNLTASGTNFNFTAAQKIISNAQWEHTGTFKGYGAATFYDGGSPTFQTMASGITGFVSPTFLLPTGGSFQVNDHTGLNVFGFTDDANNSMIVNRKLLVNGNGTSITGDTSIIGNLTVVGNIVGGISGGSTTATKLLTARNIALAGDASGMAAFDGSAPIAIPVVINPNISSLNNYVLKSDYNTYGDGRYAQLTNSYITILTAGGYYTKTDLNNDVLSSLYYNQFTADGRFAPLSHTQAATTITYSGSTVQTALDTMNANGALLNASNNFSGISNTFFNVDATSLVVGNITMSGSIIDSTSGVTLGIGAAGVSVDGNLLATVGGNVASSTVSARVANSLNLGTIAGSGILGGNITYDGSNAITANLSIDYSITAQKVHTHNYADITLGSVPFAVLPVAGTGVATTIALSDHNHTGIYEPVIGAKKTAFNVDFGGTGSAITASRSDHTQAFSTITGQAVIGQLPAGTSGSQVAFGNHSHTGVYAPAGSAYTKTELQAIIAALIAKINGMTSTDSINGPNQPITDIDATGLPYQ